MRKLFTAIFVLLMALFYLPAQADLPFRFEASIGRDVASTQGNGAWYQEGFPYTLDLKNTTWSVGITGKYNERVDWHIDYQNLGIFRSNAYATPVDSNYNPNNNPPCNGPCVAVSNFITNGSANGIKFLVDYHTLEKPNSPVFGLSAGPYVFRPVSGIEVRDWKQNIGDPGQTVYARNNGDLKLGAVFGGFVRYDDFEVRLEYILAKCTPSAQACLWKNITNLSLVKRF